MTLYEGSAERGEFGAQVALARLYSQGGQVPLNTARALKWYRAAVLQADGVEDDPDVAEAQAYVARLGGQEAGD